MAYAYGAVDAMLVVDVMLDDVCDDAMDAVCDGVMRSVDVTGTASDAVDDADECDGDRLGLLTDGVDARLDTSDSASARHSSGATPSCANVTCLYRVRRSCNAVSRVA